MAKNYDAFYGIANLVQAVNELNRLKKRVKKLEEENKKLRKHIKETKIYIVTGGCVTDYHNVAAFTNKKLAETFAIDYKKKNPCEDVDVEEYVWKENAYKKEIDTGVI